MRKWQNVTEEDIRRGISSGQYKEDGLLVRDSATGQVIKVLKSDQKSENGVPPTFIQVHNSVVYHYDDKSLIRELSKHKQESGFVDLEERYGVVLQCAGYYTQYGNEYLDELLRRCIDVAPVFYSRISKHAATINDQTIDSVNIEQFCGSLGAYVKVLLLLLICTLRKHGKAMLGEIVILDSITKLEQCVRPLYEQLLAYSHGSAYYLNNSLYAMYCFHDGYDFAQLDRIAKQDSRFGSTTNVMNHIKRHHRTSYDTQTSRFYALEFNTQEISPNSNRNKLACKLLTILEDIEKLKKIRTEITEALSADAISTEPVEIRPITTTD